MAHYHFTAGMGLSGSVATIAVAGQPTVTIVGDEVGQLLDELAAAREGGFDRVISDWYRRKRAARPAVPELPDHCMEA